jgi:hypothetical protein
MYDPAAWPHLAGFLQQLDTLTLPPAAVTSQEQHLDWLLTGSDQTDGSVDLSCKDETGAPPDGRLGTCWRSAVGGRPAKAERVAGGIGVDLEDLGRLGVVGRLQEPRAQRDRFLVRGFEVVDPQVQMQLLLWGPVRPIGGTWLGASCTPSRHSPSTTTLCQSSSASTVPPSRSAQKLLSAARSAASNTTICRLIFMQ